MFLFFLMTIGRACGKGAKDEGRNSGRNNGGLNRSNRDLNKSGAFEMQG